MPDHYEQCHPDRKNLKIEELLLRLRYRDNAVNVSSRIDVYDSNPRFSIPDMNSDDSVSCPFARGAVRPLYPQQHSSKPGPDTIDVATQGYVSRKSHAPHEARWFIQNLDRNPDRNDFATAGSGNLSPLKSSMRKKSLEQSAHDRFSASRRVRFEVSECQPAKFPLKSTSSTCLSKVCKSVAKLLRTAMPVSLRKIIAAGTHRRALVDVGNGVMPGRPKSE
jgi:hypothetical protein